MASICFQPFRVPIVRVTKTDACGTPVLSACSSVTTSGIITVEQTAELNDRQDFFALNGDGQACMEDTSPPIFKWINVTVTFCNVDPEMFNIMTGEPLVLDDAASPKAVGFRTRRGSVNTSNFGFEAWSRLGGSSNCAEGVVNYGYFLLPWMVEGMVGDMTLQNGLANFTVTARSHRNSLWGVGPYTVITNQTGPNAGNPGPLLTAITADDHRHIQVTALAPPVESCGCSALPLALAVAPTTGLAAVARVLTVPTSPSGGSTLPAVVDWGDGTALQQVTVGPTVNHTYAAPGTYTVRYWPKNFSSQYYTSVPIIVS